MKHKTLVTLGIAAIVVLLMALFMGTALAQGPNPSGSGDQLRTRQRLMTCTPEAQSDQLQLRTQDRLMICTPDGICTPQAGDQLQTQTQQRLRISTPAAQGSLLRTRTQDGTKMSAYQAQRSPIRTRAR